MSSPYAQNRVGAIAYPLSTSSSNTLLQDADPALFFYLDFWSYVLNTYIGPRLQQAAANCQPSPVVLSVASGAVAQAYPYDPTPYLAQNVFKFPLLAAFRRRGQTGRLTAGWNHDRGFFELVYVLPALDAAQAEQVGPILNAVEKELRYKTVQSFDPGYRPPGGSLGQAIATPTGGFSGCMAAGFGDPYRDNAEDVEYGTIQGAGNLFLPTLRMVGYFDERDFYVSDGNTFTGADVTIDIVSVDGTAVDPFVQVSTQPAPTISSLNVSSGSHAGGTAVTITGTGFLKGSGAKPQAPTVLFGGNLATNVAWVSATTITCSTPAMSGAGAYPLGVTVVNPDGQSASLPSAFTFT